jgi:hypothetical protein
MKEGLPCVALRQARDARVAWRPHDPADPYTFRDVLIG